MTTHSSLTTTQERAPVITAASILCIIHGVGWPIGLAPTIAYMIQNRKLRIITSPMGQFRGLGGPFEALGGIDAVILLAIVFCVINLLQFPAGYWLWKSRRKGGVLAAALLAVSALFW